jgi:hypothetical protein
MKAGANTTLSDAVNIKSSERCDYDELDYDRLAALLNTSGLSWIVSR